VRLPFLARLVCPPVLPRLVLPGKEPRASDIKISAAVALITLQVEAFPAARCT
jgi:hypothetical protein